MMDNRVFHPCSTGGCRGLVTKRGDTCWACIVAAKDAKIARLERLVRERVSDHQDPDSPFFNDCDGSSLCAWCEEAIKELAN